MSYIVYEDWYDLNSETNELKIVKENQLQKECKECKECKEYKECKMCKKYIDYILFLENSVQHLKNTQTIVYIKDKDKDKDKNEENRKTIL